MNKPIYLDYAASTPIDRRVAEKMCAFLSDEASFGNSSSAHAFGKKAKQAIEYARDQVANLIGAEASEIIWTSGATESINLALKGAANLYKRKGKHIITLKTEHKACLDACQYLEKEGFFVTYLNPLPNGLVDIELFKKTIRADTILVSFMHVNNEIGVIQDIAAIAEITAAKGILFHIDAAQSAGKIAIEASKIPFDLMSFCSHKIYGPKGIGALYLRKKPRVRVSPLIHGGGHEQGMRSGTLATHQIVGMGEAFAVAKQNMHKDYKQIEGYRNQFLAGLKKIPNMQLNHDLATSIPNILNLRFEGMIADAILAALPSIATSTASACQGKGTEGSYVLRAIGLNEEQAKSSIRFSFGRLTTVAEIDSALHVIQTLFGIKS